ncbi:unnamed protein product (macronuclear) [Paramecium tetraurelia]|uniref:Paired domain-containing protein n=1 Tax=Paramecium tetraurelia TaxID=5888 RepID=A0BMJ4_PARTE|nr:uncharacterized protein GSPATT00030397001 [Paramecium tetraurelia]CAK59761.1 unnamed protein product [Paramecium tetraurelia]|eukprot:XP_001427159.1 hypothetical protein (macronuclear) [Paramecium tetraurelia strain d4-2]
MLPKSQSLYFHPPLQVLSTRNIQTEPEISKQQHTTEPHKKYSVITDEKRNFLIKQVLEEGVSVKQAAQTSEIKLSTAKAILKTYKTQGRVGKKKERQKRPKLNRKTVEKQLDQATLIKKQLPKLGQNLIYYPYSYQPPPLFYKIEYSNEVKTEI